MSESVVLGLRNSGQSHQPDPHDHPANGVSRQNALRYYLSAKSAEYFRPPGVSTPSTGPHALPTPAPAPRTPSCSPPRNSPLANCAPPPRPESAADRAMRKTHRREIETGRAGTPDPLPPRSPRPTSPATSRPRSPPPSLTQPPAQTAPDAPRSPCPNSDSSDPFAARGTTPAPARSCRSPPT